MRYAGPAALLSILGLSGCATPPQQQASPPISAASSSSASAPSPPDDPTDLIKPTTWIVGTVTTGGTGPCYGLATDEGKQYALHSTAGLTLAKGSRIRIKTQPARVRIYCGPGTLLELTAAEPLR